MPSPGSLLAVLLAVLLPVASAPAVAATKPNILFILTDDEGWPTLSCYGATKVATPHLDQLAKEGVRLTNAYVTPQCTPTRASFLTGQYTARNGMWHVIPWYGTPWAKVKEPAFTENLERGTFTLAQGLRDAGYETGIMGKWHLSHNDDGMYLGLKPEAAGYYGFSFAAPLPPPKSPGTGDKNVRLYTDQAIGFIEKNRERPWFLYLAHHTIHNQVSAPDELVAKELAGGAPAEGMFNATYLAALRHLDAETGRLLAKLQELGLREKTIVVFISDNGGVRQVCNVEPFTTGPGTARKLETGGEEYDNAPLREGKGSPYEGGLRVPCLIRWPGVTQAGTTCDTPIHIVDFLPTFLAAAGGHVPEHRPIDGVDLRPLLAGGALAARPLFWYMPLYDLRWAATPCAVVRAGDWKLIEWFGDWFDRDRQYHEGAHLELYNLQSDLSEQHDLAPAESARAEQMRGQLHAWLGSLGRELPGANPAYDPARALKETRTKPGADDKVTR